MASSKIKRGTFDSSYLETFVVDAAAVGDARCDVDEDVAGAVGVGDDAAESCCSRGSCWGRTRSSSCQGLAARKNLIMILFGLKIFLFFSSLFIGLSELTTSKCHS